MTRYTTNTDAEGHYATELAQVAIEAATEAVENHIRRNGDRVPGPFTATIECDPGDEADREVSGPDALSLREVLDRSVPDGVEKHDSGWIRHDGSACPVHPMDLIDWWNPELGQSVGVRPAELNNWKSSGWYRHVRDEDGIPYCANNRLEYWAEYVATDEDGEVFQFGSRPSQESCSWQCDDGRLARAPDSFENDDHWTQTLRRVWHKGE